MYVFGRIGIGIVEGVKAVEAVKAVDSAIQIIASTNLRTVKASLLLLISPFCDGNFLAELDHTYHSLGPSIIMDQGSGDTEGFSRYDQNVRDKNELLYRQNHILLQINKTQYIERRDQVVEMCIASNGEIMEARYSTESSKNDNKYRYQGLKSTQPGRFSPSHEMTPRSQARGKDGKLHTIN